MVFGGTLICLANNFAVNELLGNVVVGHFSGDSFW